jgi:hypothetical protein
MNNNRYTPKDIVEQRFSIPLYQRLFAWTPKEVRKLLSDLKEHFDSERFKIEKNAYYLGMLTAIEREEYIDLIDGQQRFTVMILMAIAFKHIPEWNSFLNAGKRLKLVARSEDENYLRKLANDASLSHHLNIGNSYYNYENLYMKNALLCIYDYIEEVFGDDEKAKDIYALNIYNHLTFFISELPSHYLKEATSLNKYFEVLNSTGRGLEQHEILKVKLIRNQQDSHRLVRIWNAVSQMEFPIIRRSEDINDHQYADLYRYAIKECRLGNFDNALSNIKDSINDAQENANTIDVIPVKKKEKSSGFQAVERQDGIISFPEFLLLSLDLSFDLNGKDGFYQKDKLIERFEKHVITDIDSFYNNLLFYRLLLDYYVVRRDISNGQSRFTINFRDNDRENRECLRQYLSMLSVSTEFYIWLIPYMKLLLQLPNDWLDASVILQKLKDEDNMRRCVNGYPQILRTEKYPNIDRYWFWRLDYYLWEQRADYFNTEDRRIVDEYVFRTNRSIEHLHPQDESYNEAWDSDITNGFGNLAMISQSFNSLQSNDNIRVKFARIQEQLDNKSLQSLKMLVMFRSANEDHSKWSEQLALDNLDQMCSLLEKTVSKSNHVSSENLSNE